MNGRTKSWKIDRRTVEQKIEKRRRAPKNTFYGFFLKWFLTQENGIGKLDFDQVEVLSLLRCYCARICRMIFYLKFGKTQLSESFKSETQNFRSIVLYDPW